MIFLLYGADDYSSRQKLNALKGKFIEKNGDFNLLTLNNENILNFGSFRNAVETMPLFGDKKLVVVLNLLSQGKDSELKQEIAEYLSKLPETSFVIFYEDSAEIDKRQTLYKRLAKLAQTEEFAPITSYRLNQWIMAKAAELQMQITEEAVNQLILAVGSNLWQMEQELNKLALYKLNTGRAVTEEDVKELVTASLQSNIFSMIDYIGQKKPKLALQELAILKQSGEVEVYILSMIVYQFRNLLQAKSIEQQGGTQKDLERKAKLHPFVAVKSMKQAENFTFAELKEIYQKLLELDYQLKTGQIENKLALEKFIVEVVG